MFFEFLLLLALTWPEGNNPCETVRKDLAPAICEDAKLAIQVNPDDAGFSVALQGDTAILGTPEFDFTTHNYGAVLAWERDGLWWQFTQLVQPSDSSTQDRFGYSVALDGDTLVVGAIGQDTIFEDTGAAYVFECDPDTGEWIEHQQLLPADVEEGTELGYAVAIQGETLAVSSIFQYDRRGAVYIYNRIDGQWVQSQVLSPTGGDAFGAAITIAGDTMVVGSIGEGNFRGAAYVYRFNGQQWIQTQRLIAPDRQSNDFFGVDVAIQDDLILVGASRDDVIKYDEGSARVFRFNGSTWVHEATLTAPNPFPDFYFGDTVAFHDGAALVGATLEDTFFPVSRGVVHRYENDGGDWIHTHRLVPSDAQAGGGQAFGCALDVDGDTLLVGASWDDDYGTNSGAAYVFDLECGEFATLNSITVAFGSHISGGLQNIIESDDSFFRARSRFGFTASEPNLIDLRINATAAQTNPPNTIDLIIEARLNIPGGTVRVRLRDWTQGMNGTFQTVHTYALGNQEKTEFVENVPDGANYIRASDDRIELSLRQSVFATFSILGFDSFLDFVGIEVEE